MALALPLPLPLVLDGDMDCFPFGVMGWVGGSLVRESIPKGERAMAPALFLAVLDME